MLSKELQAMDKEKLIDLFIEKLRGDEVRIPVSIFSVKLSSLELIVKYLKEELEWSNKKIALTILRTPQNVWITYRNACQKFDGKLNVKPSEYDIPIRIFADKKLSTLEALVNHLQKDLNDKEIADILHRNKKTITTIRFRAKKKNKINN